MVPYGDAASCMAGEASACWTSLVHKAWFSPGRSQAAGSLALGVDPGMSVHPLRPCIQTNQDQYCSRLVQSIGQVMPDANLMHGQGQGKRR